MAKQKLSALAAPFQGKWRIAEMDVWDNEAIDLLGPAFIAFKGQEGRDALHRAHRLARCPL